MQTKLEQFFTERGTAESTRQHYRASVKIYEKLSNKSLDSLIEEADAEEDNGIRWKKRTVKQRLVDFRNYLYNNKSEGTARQYLADVQTIYRHYEIELQPLPNFAAKNSIDKTYEMSFEDILTKEELIDGFHEANNTVKCIILFASSSGLSKVDIFNTTVRDFIEGCGCKGNNLIEDLQELKNQQHVIPTFRGFRQKTKKPYLTFCSPEASRYIIQYLIGRNAKIELAYQRGESEYKCLCLDDKLFDISETHFARCLREINEKLNFGIIGKHSKFRCHMLRKYHATTLVNVENGFTVEEIDTLQGRSQDKTHRAYFHNSKDKLYKKYLECVDELMLFESIHDVDKAEFERLKVENAAYSSKLEEQQEKINQIISNQRELEKMLGIGE